MKTSDIITSQFVSLTQTPAGVAERLVARIIDYIVIGVYFFALWTAFDKYNWLLGCPVRCSEKQMLKSPIKLLI